MLSMNRLCCLPWLLLLIITNKGTEGVSPVRVVPLPGPDSPVEFTFQRLHEEATTHRLDKCCGTTLELLAQRWRNVYIRLALKTLSLQLAHGYGYGSCWFMMLTRYKRHALVGESQQDC